MIPATVLLGSSLSYGHKSTAPISQSPLFGVGITTIKNQETQVVTFGTAQSVQSLSESPMRQMWLSMSMWIITVEFYINRVGLSV